MHAHGWYKVAFEREITQDLTPAVIGQHRLVITRTAEGLQTFSADCPHRGAHLAYGGRQAPHGNGIMCPFHGYRIGLGEPGYAGFMAKQYPTLVIGGMIFVRLSESHDYGFAAFMAKLAEDHVFVPGFGMPVKVAAPLVIENAFDNHHFQSVHHIGTEKFVVEPAADGHLVVESAFTFPAKPDFKSETGDIVTKLSFTAHTFSPGIIVSQLGGGTPYTVLTASTPLPDGTCMIRLSLALPRFRYGDPPSPEFSEMILAGSRQGLVDDQLMWENLSPTAPHQYVAQDAAVLAFQKFCTEFEPSEKAAVV